MQVLILTINQDAVFLFNNQPHNLEIKLDLATDFGQGTLNYKNTCLGIR